MADINKKLAQLISGPLPKKKPKPKRPKPKKGS